MQAQPRLAGDRVENSAGTDSVPTYPECLPPEYLRDLRDLLCVPAGCGEYVAECVVTVCCVP